MGFSINLGGILGKLPIFKAKNPVSDLLGFLGNFFLQFLNVWNFMKSPKLTKKRGKNQWKHATSGILQKNYKGAYLGGIPGEFFPKTNGIKTCGHFLVGGPNLWTKIGPLFLPIFEILRPPSKGSKNGRFLAFFCLKMPLSKRRFLPKFSNCQSSLISRLKIGRFRTSISLSDSMYKKLCNSFLTASKW